MQSAHLQATRLRAPTRHDLDQLRRLGSEAFRDPIGDHVWLRRGRILGDEGRIDGALAIAPLGQFFGGARVDSAVLDWVCVPVHSRGRGLGRQLVAQALLELRDGHVGVAALVGSAHAFYRRLGFELSGVRFIYETALPSSFPSQSAPPVEPWDDADLGDVHACYLRFAREVNGFLDRSEEWWHSRVLDERSSRPLYRYACREHGRVTGYIVYVQRPVPGALDAYSLDCRELISTTPASASALTAFLAGHQALGRFAEWPGPADDPRWLDQEQDRVRVRHCVPWMCRIVDVEAALRARGYPPDIELSIDVRLVDPILRANTGALRLAIADGHGSVEHRSDARMTVDIGALSAMFTGWLHPLAARRAGRLQGASPSEIAMLSAAFSGPSPWMPELI